MDVSNVSVSTKRPASDPRLEYTLLKYDELKKIRATLGNTSTILSSTVARLYIAPDGVNWEYTGLVGALLFLVDRRYNAFLFQMYEIDTVDLLWETELYYGLNYESIAPHFHCFEGTYIPIVAPSTQ